MFVVDCKDNTNCRIQALVVAIFHKLKKSPKK